MWRNTKNTPAKHPKHFIICISLVYKSTEENVDKRAQTKEAICIPTMALRSSAHWCKLYCPSLFPCGDFHFVSPPNPSECIIEAKTLAILSSLCFFLIFCPVESITCTWTFSSLPPRRAKLGLRLADSNTSITVYPLQRKFDVKSKKKEGRIIENFILSTFALSTFFKASVRYRKSNKKMSDISMKTLGRNLILFLSKKSHGSSVHLIGLTLWGGRNCFFFQVKPFFKEWWGFFSWGAGYQK